METDGQTYFCCSVCDEFVNTSEAEAHNCAPDLTELFCAMENHGNETGTETQLGDCDDFLHLAFHQMSLKQQHSFLERAEVEGFIKQWIEGDKL